MPSSEIHHIWEDGGAYALLGPSGCGKTTLLNIISGLLTPSRGRSCTTGRMSPTCRRKNATLPRYSSFPVLYDTMTVFDNLAFPLRNRGHESSDIDRRVREVADILDLTPYLKKRAAGLAADAKQKISLGRGLVRSDVAAILFDEPLTVIDPHLKWNLRRKLKDIHEQLKLTFIYVTHDQVEALTFADKVVVMYEGEIVQIGSPQDLFENPEHTFVGYFIGSPGMNFLDCTLEGNGAMQWCSIPWTRRWRRRGASPGKTGIGHTAHVPAGARRGGGRRSCRLKSGCRGPGQLQDCDLNAGGKTLRGQAAGRPGRYPRTRSGLFFPRNGPGLLLGRAV